MSISIRITAKFKGEINGRLLLFIDRPGEHEEEMLYKRSGFGMKGCPVFGVTFYGLKSGDLIELDEQKDKIFGSHFPYKAIPKEKLEVQAFFIRYEKYERRDGHTLWGMKDYGGGGNFAENPYNLYSDVKLVDLAKKDVVLKLDKQIEPTYKLKGRQVYQQGNYRNHGLVKYFKMKSDLLSDFWGEDIYMGANILLPKNYDRNKKYPMIYCLGHFPGKTAPFRYGIELREREKGFTEYWNSGKAPEVICVNFRHANMFYDDSYLVNSENLGPWGDAFVKEIIPAIEEKYGGIGVPEGRILTGGSTGGWIAVALQLFYPDFFGGSWPGFADSLDFHGYQLADLYNDANVYKSENGWYSIERPGARDVKGNVLWTMRDEHYYELAIGGDLAHGMGQYGIYQAVFSPCGEDGYPLNAYDPISGEINKDVVAYWHDHYDLTAYLEEHHKELVPKIKGKFHLRAGDMDNFYLNLGHYAFTDVLKKYRCGGYSVTFPRIGHDGNITIIEMMEEMRKHLDKVLYKKK